MPQSFAAVYLHVIFSTKHRLLQITADLSPRLHAYLGGIARGNKHTLLTSGGMLDHVHLLLSMGREQSTAELVGLIKSGSSRWVHDTFPEHRAFAWQSGYGAFSIGRTELDMIRGYIDMQAEHHRARTFQEEYRDFLQQYGLSYDERYVWD